MNSNINQNHHLFFIFLTILVAFGKIIIQLFVFKVPIDLATIVTLKDSFYLPLIDSFSDLNFNPSYSKDLNDLSFISYPALGLIINIIFYKIFGIYSFLILEIICIYLFLLIFYKIFISQKFSQNTAIFLSLFLFLLPFFSSI